MELVPYITAWKVSVLGVIPVRIFSYLDWIFRISPYSVRMRENADQNNSEYEHFLRSGCFFLSSSIQNEKVWSFVIQKKFADYHCFITSKKVSLKKPEVHKVNAENWIESNIFGPWLLGFTVFFTNLITKIYPLKLDPTNCSNTPKKFMGNISDELLSNTRPPLVEETFWPKSPKIAWKLQKQCFLGQNTGGTCQFLGVGE